MAFVRRSKVAAGTATPVGRSEVKGSGTAAAIKAVRPVVTHEAVAKRAYEIYAQRGYSSGNPDEDWLEAERQLRTAAA